MKFPDGTSELVLKNNPNLNFAETEIVVEDVLETYESLKSNPEIEWISTPFPNSLGGHVAVNASTRRKCFCVSRKISTDESYYFSLDKMIFLLNKRVTYFNKE